MSRRSLSIIGILLLCVFMGACTKKEAMDDFITEDKNLNIDEVNMSNEDIEDMIIKEDEELIVYDNQAETIKKELTVEEVKKYSPGAVVDTSELSKDLLNSLFYSEELSQEIIDRITGKSYKEDCDIPYSDLRYIRVLHMGFDGLTHIGEMIVNKAIAQDVVEIFKDLYSISYPIEKMILIDEYDADDNKSMEDNNSSAFNFRFVDGTRKRSVHSDGLAIDINPLYNPYVRTRNGVTEVLPESGTKYTSRNEDNPYYIKKGDPCYEAFISRGFTWGGEWINSKDYQHFEKKDAH